jgi:hypothetical protein
MHTNERLFAALTEAGLPELAAKAATGYYHDYESPLDCPALALVDALARVKTPAATALIERVADGEFDATKDEAEAWANSPAGLAMMRRSLPGWR